MTVVKGVQRDSLLAGDWGCPPAYKKSPKIGGYRGLIESISAVSGSHCHPGIALSLALLAMTVKKSSHLATTVVKGVQRDSPLAGDWGCPPAYKKSPKIGGYRGLIETISTVSKHGRVAQIDK